MNTDLARFFTSKKSSPIKSFETNTPLGLRVFLDKLITSGYDLLNLNTFFTSGPKETRAWTIKKNTVAQKAAGVIHSDFEKNFIRAEVVSYDDFNKYGSFEKAKENGKLKVEGKNYFVKDGDVLIFRVNP